MFIELYKHLLVGRKPIFL